MRSFFLNFIIIFILMILGCGKVSQKNFDKKKAQSLTYSDNLTGIKNLDNFEIICPIPNIAFTDMNEWRSYLSNCLTLDSAFVENIPTGKYLVVIEFGVTQDGKAIKTKIIQEPGFGLGEKGLEIFNSYKGKWYWSAKEEYQFSNPIIMEQPIFFEIEK